MCVCVALGYETTLYIQGPGLVYFWEIQGSQGWVCVSKSIAQTGLLKDCGKMIERLALASPCGHLSYLHTDTPACIHTCMCGSLF